MRIASRAALSYSASFCAQIEEGSWSCRPAGRAAGMMAALGRGFLERCMRDRLGRFASERLNAMPAAGITGSSASAFFQTCIVPEAADAKLSLAHAVHGPAHGIGCAVEPPCAPAGGSLLLLRGRVRLGASNVPLVSRCSAGRPWFRSP